MQRTPNRIIHGQHVRLSVFCHCDKCREDQLERRKACLAHSFRGFSPRSLNTVTWPRGQMVGNTRPKEMVFLMPAGKWEPVLRSKLEQKSEFITKCEKRQSYGLSSKPDEQTQQSDRFLFAYLTKAFNHYPIVHSLKAQGNEYSHFIANFEGTFIRI